MRPLNSISLSRSKANIALFFNCYVDRLRIKPGNNRKENFKSSCNIVTFPLSEKGLETLFKKKSTSDHVILVDNLTVTVRVKYFSVSDSMKLQRSLLLACVIRYRRKIMTRHPTCMLPFRLKIKYDSN